MSQRIWPGRPFPLGATWDGNGTNFSLFSEHAERVELCLFDEADRETRVDLRERTALNWHGFLPDVRPGQRYAYRVHGPWDPAKGHRFNPSKLLIDPYAKAIEGPIAYDAANVLPYEPDGEDADLVRDDDRRRRRDPALHRHRRGLRLAGRPAAGDALARDADLRGAREGLHQA